MDPRQAQERFASAQVMRLATVDPDRRPHVVVATFAVDGDRIYTAIDHKPKRTRDLARLRNIAENPYVSALTDHYDPDDWSRLWWARADGTARIVADDGEQRAPVDLLVARYAQYRRDRPQGPVIEITVDRWSGWAST